MGRFGASRGFQLNWLGHFHASRDSNLNWVGRFGASRRLQLINIRLIPNSARYCSFLVVLCDVRRIMQAQTGRPERLVVFGLGVTTWLRMLRGRR